MEHYATAQQVFAGGLIFARLGALVMLIPGLGETFVPPRIRLAFAFAMTLALYPLLSAGAPALPGTVSELAGAVIKEALIGLMIGGNVESILAMTTSACFAAGLGGFTFADLDTPLFLAENPFAGGFTLEGGLISVAHLGAGHGVSPLVPA